MIAVLRLSHSPSSSRVVVANFPAAIDFGFITHTVFFRMSPKNGVRHPDTTAPTERERVTVEVPVAQALKLVPSRPEREQSASQSTRGAPLLCLFIRLLFTPPRETRARRLAASLTA